MAENPEQQATSGAGGPAIDPEVSPTDIHLKVEDIDLAPEVDRGAGSDVAAYVARHMPTGPRGVAAAVAGAAVGGVAVGFLGFLAGAYVVGSVVGSVAAAVAGGTAGGTAGVGAGAVVGAVAGAVAGGDGGGGGGDAPADKAINNFWSENNDKVEKAVRKALEKGTVNPDPQVIEIRAGSLLVKLRCHTPRSFLQFVSDYESQKVKRRLEEELSAVGFRKELTIDIKNKEEVEEKNKKLRYVSFIC